MLVLHTMKLGSCSFSTSELRLVAIAHVSVIFNIISMFRWVLNMPEEAECVLYCSMKYLVVVEVHKVG